MNVIVPVAILNVETQNANDNLADSLTSATESNSSFIGSLIKEVCNRGVACSLLKLGSLEKTVIASLFYSGLHSGSPFLSKKGHILSFPNMTYDIIFSTKNGA